MSSSAVLPRGTPLTPVVEFIAPEGVSWVAYIESTPPVRRWRLLSQTVLPGRRLRFDSVDDSRVHPTVPAGSPFLAERRLRVLLAEAGPLPPSRPASPSPVSAPERRSELLHTARQVWAWVRETAAVAGRTAWHRVLAYPLHAARGDGPPPLSCR